MNVAQLLVRTARIYPDRPALYYGDELLCDYRGLADRAARIAAHLSGVVGLAPGERVALYMTNTPEYLELLYGAWYAGLIVVPVNAKLHPREVEFILRDSGAAGLFITEDVAAGLQPVLKGLDALKAVVEVDTHDFRAMYRQRPVDAVPRAPDDVAWLFYTSGTTGRPKGVMIMHKNLHAMIACHFMCVAPTAGGDTVIYAAPMSHAAGLGNFQHVMVGARHVVPLSPSFEPAEIFAIAEKFGNCFLFAAPTMVKRLSDHALESGASAAGFKAILYGGGPMYLEDIKTAVRVMGECFVQAYGQGETPMTITVLSTEHIADREHSRHDHRLGSVGVPQSLVEVRVIDENGADVPSGGIGEIVVRGDTVMKGYWRNAEATAKAIRDGWLYTGDMGSFDEEGFLTLKDRCKDMIISGGSNIYPREIEEVLLQHPGVQEVSIVGRKHPEWGEEVVAFVVAKPGRRVEPRELDELCLRNIARYKRPKAYRMIGALPKNNYGKVLKTNLRDLLNEEQRTPEAAAAQ